MLEISIIIFVVVADQISKYLANNFLKPLVSVPIIKGVFNLTYVENRGAAFGIMQNQRWILVILPLIIIAAIVIYLIAHPNESLLRKISLAIILGGAIGNLVDRVLLGYVVDMFNTTFISFPVFNVADSAVVCGTFLLAYQLLFKDQPQS